MELNCDVLVRGLAEWKIELTKEQKDQFIRYYEMLVKKNEVMNLTAITEWEEVQVKHFLDSLACFSIKEISDFEGKRFIDVGTGAGFPGIPIKILCPELDVVLADSLKKRLLFLDEVIAELGLKKIETVHGRAEDLGKNPLYRESFDFCVSRAVANLSTLSEYCLPFLKVGGMFIPYKSGEIKEELQQSSKAITILGGKLMKETAFSLPGTDIDRTILQIKKEKTTPKKYPRKAGTPAKEPL